MAPGNQGSKIVETKSGKLTGETLYLDEHGTWWTTESPHDNGTGKRHAYVDNGQIKEKP
jgi:hypothetical protein